MQSAMPYRRRRGDLSGSGGRFLPAPSLFDVAYDFSCSAAVSTRFAPPHMKYPPSHYIFHPLPPLQT